MGNKKQLISIYFKYPRLQTIRMMTPKDRVRYIESKFQEYYRIVSAKLEGHHYELIGTKRKPRGVKLSKQNRLVDSILRLKFMNKSLSTLLTTQKTKVPNGESYFCFRTIFAVQIEGQLKGPQTYDDRYILVKADSWERAEKKLLRNVKALEVKEYLNPYGQIVRWKFESIEESYHTFVPSDDNFDKPVEVFSKLKERRLTRERIWDGTKESSAELFKTPKAKTAVRRRNR